MQFWCDIRYSMCSVVFRVFKKIDVDTWPRTFHSVSHCCAASMAANCYFSRLFFFRGRAPNQKFFSRVRKIQKAIFLIHFLSLLWHNANIPMYGERKKKNRPEQKLNLKTKPKYISRISNWNGFSFAWFFWISISFIFAGLSKWDSECRELMKCYLWHTHTHVKSEKKNGTT